MEQIKDCPFCGRKTPDDLEDTLYPSGGYWRETDGMRHYVSHRERKPGDSQCWTMHCGVGGWRCGAQITADTREEAIAAWNRRAAIQQAAVPEGLVPCPNCDGAGSVMVPSDNGPDAYDMEVACPHCDGKQTLPDAYLGVVKLLKAERASHQKTYSIIWGHYGTVQSEALQRQIKRIAAQIKPENLDWLRDRLNDLAASAEGYLAASPAPPKQQETVTNWTVQIMENYKPRRLRLTIGVQSFDIDVDDEEDGRMEWFRDMLTKAMKNATSPPKQQPDLGRGDGGGVSQWLPIETAPKDGTPVILADIADGQVYDVVNGYFEVLSEDEDDGPWSLDGGEPKCSYVGRAEGTYFCAWLPAKELETRWRVTETFEYTHWMPLPPAPIGQINPDSADLIAAANFIGGVDEHNILSNAEVVRITGTLRRLADQTKEGPV